MAVPQRKVYARKDAIKEIARRTAEDGQTRYLCADHTIRTKEDLPPLPYGRRRYTSRSKYDARTGKLIEE